jgi:hypothetical protein
MRNIFAGILLSLFVISCHPDDSLKYTGHTAYVFGVFNGFCRGEACIEIFKWDGEHLYEDIHDDYPEVDDFYKADFERMDESIARRFQGLEFSVPDSLLLKEDIVYGIPDGYDQGGLYFEIRTKDLRQFWLLDQDPQNLPDFLIPLHEEINEWVERTRD